MTLNREDGPNLTPSSDLEVIEISSDSEDDLFCQPHHSKCHGATIQGEDENKDPKPCVTSENDVIELTDSSDSNDLSDFPNMLSPLVRKSRGKQFGGSRRQPLDTKFVSLYADASDNDESESDCILVLNDPPGSRKPIRTVLPTVIGIGHNVTKETPLLESSKKNAAPKSSQAVQKTPRRKGQKAKEQARLQTYATELFVELNRDVFGDRLPKDTTLEWSKRLLTTAGRARWHRSRDGLHTTKIELASKILDCDERIRNTLSHEMCHLACWVIDNQPQEGHGRFFKSWANKVTHKRPDIHISTRHSYEISYPYEWKCEKCSKIYGRYSKSIRPDECVCGVCKAGRLIPLFAQRKPTTPKVSRMAMIGPRDSPRSIIAIPEPISDVPTENENLPPSTNEAIVDLVKVFKDIFIDNATEQQADLSLPIRSLEL